MNILHLIASPTWTGPVEPTVRVAEALTARGHTIRIACDGRRPGDLALRLGPLRIAPELVLSAKSWPWDFAHDARAQRRLVSAYRFDIVHCHFTHDHSVAAMASLDVPIVRSIHRERSLRDSFARQLLYRRTAAFTVPSQNAADLFARSYERPAFVLSGVVDTIRFRPSASTSERNAARALLGVTDDRPLIGCVARMNEGRAQELLVDALCDIRKQLPGARLALCGRGERESLIRRHAQDRGCQDEVLFPGYLDADQLPLAYRAFDLFAMPREGNDGTARALLEAMASGVACAAAHRGGMADSIVDGESGRHFTDGDAGSCGAALVDAWQERHRLGPSARERAVRMFQVGDRALELERFYGAVVDGTLAP